MSTRSAPTIVIGAGLSGLSAALALARAGRDVTVIEATCGVGGCCSNTTVDGYTFNNGAVYVALPSLLRRAFARLGLDLDDEVPLIPITQPHETHLDDGTVVHLGSLDASRVEGSQAALRSMQLRDGLGKLQRDWQPLYRRLVDDILPHELSTMRTLALLWRHLPKMSGHADRLIRRYFADSALQASVASMLLYTGTAPQRLPASQLIGVLALLDEGFHLPRRGMGAITAALRRALHSAGVEIRCGSKVEHIEVSRGAVSGVLLDSGERMAARDVIATCAGFSVVNQLLPPASRPRAMRRLAGKAPLSHRAVAIQLGGQIAPTSGAFIVNHVPDMTRQGDMHRVTLDEPRWLSWTSPSSVSPELAPAGKAVVELFAPVSGISRAQEWTPSMTTHAVERHVAALQRHLPGMRVETIRTLDPQDFAQQRHLYEGALYGIAPGANPALYFPHRTSLPGLYLAGQTTFPGFGVPSAMYSGLQAAEGLLAADR